MSKDYLKMIADIEDPEMEEDAYLVLAIEIARVREKLPTGTRAWKLAGEFVHVIVGEIGKRRPNG